MAPMILGIQWTDPSWLLSQFGSEFFWISLLIVFVECGLLFPFLPGDTLLFSMGLFVATDKIRVFPGNQAVELLACLALLVVAAFAGNVVGYAIGRWAGQPLRERDGRFLKRKHLDQTADFFDRHGNKALVIGRFVPFVRTYITLVAGVTRMDRRRFWLWSLVGAVLWVAAITLAGYFLGAAFPSLGENIDKAVYGILLVSLVPVAVEWWRHRDHHDDTRAAGSRSATDSGAGGGTGTSETSVDADRV